MQILSQTVPLQAINDCRHAGLVPATPPDAAAQALWPHPLLCLLPLDGDHAVAFVPSHSHVAVLDSAAQQLLGRLPLPEADASANAAIAELARLGLLTAAPAAGLPLPAPPQTLSAWLHMTNACNLRCSYCYIHKTNQAMDAATARAAVDAVLRAAQTHGYRQVALKYAGGEAALAIELVAQTQRYAQQQAAHHGLGLSATLLSNGTALGAPVLAVLAQLQIGLTISLDGLGAEHDAQRPMIGGRGSANAARAGVERALAAGLQPVVAITVSGQNVATLPDTLRWLLARDLAFTISFYREHDCSASHTALKLDEARIIAGMGAAYAVIAEHPPRWSLLGALLDRADLSAPHTRACAAGENYMVIDHHGNIAKCQMTLDRPISDVYAADPLLALRSDQRGVQNLPVDQKAGCKTCEWRYWCAGGCAIATYRATGRYDLQSPNCGIYQALYPEVLRLEGLRILHWGRLEASVRPPSARVQSPIPLQPLHSSQP